MQKCSQPKTKKLLYKSSPQLRSTPNVTRARIPAGDSTRAVHALQSIRPVSSSQRVRHISSKNMAKERIQKKIT